MFRITLFSFILLLIQWFVYFQFIRFLKTTKIYKPNQRYWAAIPFVLFNAPFVIISLLTRGHFNPPEWFRIYFMFPFYFWQGATFFIATWLFIGKLIKLPFKIPLWIAKIFKPLRRKIKSFGQKSSIQTVDYSRRKFVRYATFAASSYAFAAAGYGILRHDDCEIDYKDIKINNLPNELKGTTITLISDIHAGQYMNEWQMRKYADIVAELGSDIVCIPGDFVNFQSEDAEPLASAFRDVHARYGIYGSLGNHDFFQDPDHVTEVINNESPIQILRNQHRKLTIKGKDLYILGLDDTISSGANMDRVVLDYLDRMGEYLKVNEPTYEHSPKILLCHKPYSFDNIAKRNPDLVLSGHTHGGQVVPIKFGKVNISFAAALSKYIEGHYTIGNANMYISRGVGTVALPIRINCPPEITKITLV